MCFNILQVIYIYNHMKYIPPNLPNNPIIIPKKKHPHPNKNHITKSVLAVLGDCVKDRLKNMWAKSYCAGVIVSYMDTRMPSVLCMRV
jgi:hypothetical protein